MSENLQEIIDRVKAGSRDETDIRTVMAAIHSGEVVLASSPSGVGVGGNVTASQIVSGNQNVLGDHNIIIYGADAQTIQAALSQHSAAPFPPLLAVPATPQHDWGDAPDVDAFFGRQKELAITQQWIVVDRCRLVALLGMGGIGKTSFSLKLSHSIQDEFDYIIWRPLLNVPPLTNILREYLKILSQQQETHLPDTLSEQIVRLLVYLKQHRCLLILDNVEAILRSGENVGQYREG